MSSYTLLTWVCANLLYPIIFFFYIGGEPGEIISAIGVLIPFLFFSFLLSIPSLILSHLLIKWIVIPNISADAKFVLWLLIGPCIVVANFLILCFLLFREDIARTDFWPIVAPAMIAVVVVILIRFKFFYSALKNLPGTQLSEEVDPL